MDRTKTKPWYVVEKTRQASDKLANQMRYLDLAIEAVDQLDKSYAINEVRFTLIREREQCSREWNKIHAVD